MDTRKQHLILKAQEEERKKKAEEYYAEELEINRMKIEMEREQHKATLDAQMAQITVSTQANMKMIEFLTSMMGKLQNEGSKKQILFMDIYILLGYDCGTSARYSSIVI